MCVAIQTHQACKAIEISGIRQVGAVVDIRQFLAQCAQPQEIILGLLIGESLFRCRQLLSQRVCPAMQKRDVMPGSFDVRARRIRAEMGPKLAHA